MSQGLTLRAIARRLGIAVGTAWRWRHQEMARLAEQQRQEDPPLRGSVVVEAVSLDAARAYWGQSPNWYWRDRHGPQVKGEGQRTGFVTVVFAVQVDIKCRAVACRLVPGPLTRLTLGRALAACVAAGSRVWARKGTAKVCADQLGRRVVRWSPFGMTGGDSEQPLDPTPARTVRLAFNRWMARFRGVAMAYLDRYVAWFNVWIRDRGWPEEEPAL